MIGGSLAAAWRRAGVVSHVTGYDVDPAALERAVALGFVDVAAPDVAHAVMAADLVVLAAPVLAIGALLAQVATHLPPQAIVTDVGSAKQAVIEAARGALGAALARFVPAHPIAGRERPGVEAADADLFERKLVVTTPLPQTDPDALRVVEAAWQALGARVQRMSAAEHDRVFAAVSHLPHLLAFALVAQIAAGPDGERTLGYAGAGFRDFTRIAASSAVMWRDVALANRAALGDALRAYRAQLEALQNALDHGDAQALEGVFAVASAARRRHQVQFDCE
jgi:prephenate dehydrogenase